MYSTSFMNYCQPKESVCSAGLYHRGLPCAFLGLAYAQMLASLCLALYVNVV